MSEDASSIGTRVGERFKISTISQLEAIANRLGVRVADLGGSTSEYSSGPASRYGGGRGRSAGARRTGGETYHAPSEKAYHGEPVLSEDEAPTSEAAKAIREGFANAQNTEAHIPHGAGTEAEARSDVARAATQNPAEARRSYSPTVGGNINREQFADELKAKPWLRDKIMRIMANEQGSHPEGTQSVVESMMNRATVRGTSLEREARWHESEGGYYQKGNMGRGALEDPRHKAILEQGLANALAGSNVSNYATDNSSGSLARREIAQGRFIKDAAYGGETFSHPSAGEQPENARRWAEWRRQMEQGEQSSPAAENPANASDRSIPVPTSGPAPMSEPYQERAGTPIHGKSATVTLDNGVRFNVAAEHADQFGGFLNELIARGAPITEAGGFGHRPRNASAHPGGHAVDVNQQSRNVISKPLAEWWDQKPEPKPESQPEPKQAPKEDQPKKD